MNTQRKPCYELVKTLVARGVKVNVTALFTLAQVRDVLSVLRPDIPSFVSVFAGRLADSGRDPLAMMAASVELLKLAPAAELIWAGTRELINIYQADAVGCQIITVPNDILKKLPLIGIDLDEYTLDAVKAFYNDAQKAGLSL